VTEKRFRQYYAMIMEELHQCSDPESPLFYTRYSPSDENLRGRFQSKHEPRFSVEVNTWNVDEKNVLRKAGWNSTGKEQVDMNWDLFKPFHSITLNGQKVKIPRKSKEVLQERYFNSPGGYTNVTQPHYYRPDLLWGSPEMQRIKP
jgi:hypothetical protein